jgi:hypothetical protein
MKAPDESKPLRNVNGIGVIPIMIKRVEYDDENPKALRRDHARPNLVAFFSADSNVHLSS